MPELLKAKATTPLPSLTVAPLIVREPLEAVIVLVPAVFALMAPDSTNAAEEAFVISRELFKRIGAEIVSP